MDPILAVGLTTTSMKALENVVNSIYEVLGVEIGSALKKWNISRKAKDLYKHINKIRMVKTLWQVDKAVDLCDFYCDSNVLLDKKRIKITSINDFGSRRKILINGIAGQGKSILLRYLCSKALLEGTFIPIFIELRKIQSQETLFQHIVRFFDIFDVKIDELLFRALVRSNKLVLFLDGFDEVADTEKSRIMSEIEQIGLYSDDLMIIVTSRPENSIAALPLFEIVRLDDLRNGEYKAVIYKLSDSTKFAENLIKQIESHKSQLRALLCTPLLATLLVMSYKSFQELPAQLSDFYDSIFQLLLQRHDGVKPGFKRPRSCLFNDSEYRTIFEGFCFESKKNIKSIFSYGKICSYAKNALKKVNFDDNQAEKYVGDIVNVTCLILKEGDNDYRFIHKSVQEYYVAAYIKHKTDVVVKKFYSKFLENDQYFRTWIQELRFLKDIDTYRYYKFFILPFYCSNLGCTPDTVTEKCPVITLDMARKLFSKIEMWLSFKEPFEKITRCNAIRWQSFMLEEHLKFIAPFFELDFMPLAEAVKSGVIKMNSPAQGFKETEMVNVTSEVNILQLLNAGVMKDEIFKLGQEIIISSFKNIAEAIHFIKNEESVDISLELDI